MTASSPFRILEVSGHQITPWIDKLGDLRIRVFREFPYLYDGTLEYERDYLQVYRDCPRSLVVLVTDERSNLVGATTCMPLADECDEFRGPFEQAGLAVEDFLYFGESVILREWRGRGLGREFFRRREMHARTLGLSKAAFCAVDRPADHPARPNDYRDLSDFWSAMGFARQPKLKAWFPWKELGESEESLKSLTFWIKSMACQTGENSNPEPR